MQSVICADSLTWLKSQRSIPNVVTGICDQAETDMQLEAYTDFLQEVADQIFTKLQIGCYAIFIQTDRKHNRQLVDKSYILTHRAYAAGLKCVWHKVVLQRDVDKVDLYRPTYSHVLCYAHPCSRTGTATPDVIPLSKKSYANGTPPLAARRCLEFIVKYSKSNFVLDPFLGRGTISQLCEELGLHCIGIDISMEQCKLAASHLKTPVEISYNATC